jgi:hypothetical protein
MANINFPNGGKVYTQHITPVIIDAQILIGSTGAVTSFTGNAIASVVRNGTGDYTLNLNQAYYSAIVVMGSAISASGALSGILGVECANAPSTAVSSASAPKIQIYTLDAAGAKANPVSGSTIQVMAILSNSSVKGGASV